MYLGSKTSNNKWYDGRYSAGVMGGGDKNPGYPQLQGWDSETRYLYIFVCYQGACLRDAPTIRVVRLIARRKP